MSAVCFHLLAEPAPRRWWRQKAPSCSSRGQRRPLRQRQRWRPGSRPWRWCSRWGETPHSGRSGTQRRAFSFASLTIEKKCKKKKKCQIKRPPRLHPSTAVRRDEDSDTWSYRSCQSPGRAGRPRHLWICSQLVHCSRWQKRQGTPLAGTLQQDQKQRRVTAEREGAIMDCVDMWLSLQRSRRSGRRNSVQNGTGGGRRGFLLL